jgi:NADPH:quinone reductase-like Zn-dependent oxidoreductase
LLPDQPFEGGDPRLVLLKKVGRSGVLVEGAGLVSFDPDADQVARDIVAFFQTVERFASQILLRDLTLKFDAVGSILGHELSSFESPACWSNVKSSPVRPEGPTPISAASTCPASDGAHLALLGEATRSLSGSVLSGELKVDVGHRFPMNQVELAHRAIEERRTVGKVVLEPWS